MSAPPGDITDRLERLAAQAPTPSVDPDAVWSRGRLRQRVRAGVVLAAVVVVGLLGTVTTPLLVARADQVEPAGSDDRMVLPDVLRSPGGWEPAFAATPDRLSAIGTGRRSGLLSSSPSLWGVSAATGESRWLDLPDSVVTAQAPARLSADGRRLAYWVTGATSGEPLATGGAEGVVPVVGVAVMELGTGEVTRWDIDSDHGLSVRGLVWSGDVLWWQGGPLVPMGGGSSSAELRTRTWDVSTDDKEELGGRDPRAAVYLSQPGSAPGGFVTLPRTFRLEQVTGGDAPIALRTDLPDDVPSSAVLIDPEMAPDGARVAALVVVPVESEYDNAADKQLLVGTVADGTVTMEAVADVRAQAVLGWRSPKEVVVSSVVDVDDNGSPTRQQVWVVDVATGEKAELLEVVGATPDSVAAEALTAEVVKAPDAPFAAPDPRLVGAGTIVVLAFGISLWRDLRRRRGHP